MFFILLVVTTDSDRRHIIKRIGLVYHMVRIEGDDRLADIAHNQIIEANGVEGTL